MIMADVLKIALLIIGQLIVFVSYWLAAEALFPVVVERARQQYDSHAIRATLLGLVIVVPFVALGIAVGKSANPLLKLISAILIGTPVLLGMLGSAGLSRRIGAGLPSLIDEQQPWRRGLRGGIVLALLFLLPLIGWFFVLPLTLISGCGAALMALAPQRKEVRVPPTIAAANTVAG